MGNDTRGSHEWVIEFDKEPDDLDHFIEILDTDTASQSTLIMRPKDTRT
ncbi:MAG: hypothetical protein MZV63_21855 [Marinilabiliales bacterium]|nr:hypothetical protein [Marinilabiliales bacterium]